MVERPVPSRIVLQGVHADGLCGHADPDKAAAEELGVPETPVGRGVQPAAHVEPLDLDDAVELRRILRTAYEHAGAVRRGRGRLHVPAPVFAERPGGLVGARRAFDEELLFDVAAWTEIDRRQGRRIPGDRTAHGRVGDGLLLGARRAGGVRAVDGRGANGGEDGQTGESPGKHDAILITGPASTCVRRPDEEVAEHYEVDRAWREPEGRRPRSLAKPHRRVSAS